MSKKQKTSEKQQGHALLASVGGSAYYIRENNDETFSVVRWTNEYGGYELEMIRSTRVICEEWIAKRT